MTSFNRSHIISLEIANISFDKSLHQVIGLAIAKKPAFICFANVHMIVEAWRDRSFCEVLKKADLVLADGKPVANACFDLYRIRQERISGMDFLPGILEEAGKKRLSVFIYGSESRIIEKAEKRIRSQFPGIEIKGHISPPFRRLTEPEINNDIELIGLSGADLVLVSLGCPRQEKWMAAHSDKINSVLLGIGGALPVFAGLEKRAPAWMQDRSLEWLYRLYQHPTRLFRRYAITNTIYTVLLLRERLRKKR